MGEQGDNSQKIVRRKEELVGWDVEPCRSEVEVGVKLQDGAPDQDGSNVNGQEEGEVSARRRLQPGYETLALMPSTYHKPQPAGHLEGHAQEKNALDRPVPLHRSCGFHERNVCGYA